MGVQVRQKDGKWYVFINHQGSRKAKCIGSDKRLALQVQKQLEAKLTLGDMGLLKDEPETVLFRDYAEQWLERCTPLTCKPSSRRVLQGIVCTHLLPAFGAQELRSITRNQVKTFVTTKLQSLSPGHVRNLVRTFHTICAQAVDDEVLDRNPASRLGKFMPEKRLDPEKAIDPCPRAGLERYLTTMHARYPQYYAYFLTLARTGMRQGEALGLRWDDLQCGVSPDHPYRFIHVQRTYDSAHNLMNAPKSGKIRRVDMAKDLRACLLDWREQCFEQAVLAGRTTLAPILFPTATGHPWTASRIYVIHKRCCALAGLRATRVHDLRHSYATIMLYELHAPIQYVSAQLGHSSIKITVDIYGPPRQGISTHLVDQLTQLSATLAQPDAASVA
jgi:integrase